MSAALISGALLVGAFAPVAGAATSPTPPTSLLTLAGGGLLPAGQADTDSNPTVSPYGDGLSFVGVAGGLQFRVTLSGPSNGPLAVGTYTTSRGPEAPDVAFLDAGVGGSGCGYGPGQVHIYQLDRDPDTQTIKDLAATYSFNCEGGAATVGELRYQATVPAVRFGVVTAGSPAADQSVTVTAQRAVTFGAAAITSPFSSDAAPAFSLKGDTCSNHAIPAGGSCVVTVGGWAVSLGVDLGLLTIPDTAGSDTREVSLSIQGKETPKGAFAGVKPTRILDTRTGTGAPKARLGAGKSLTLQVTGHGGIPAGVAAVVINLTVTGTTGNSYLSAYPAGTTRPTASSLNFQPGWTRANLVTVPLSTSGAITIYNDRGVTNVIGDVQGYYRTASPTLSAYGSYFPDTPWRLFDSRTAGIGKIPKDNFLELDLSYGHATDAHITAVAINLTATAPDGPGNLVAFNGDANAIPSTSSVNYAKGQTVPNMAIVPVTQQIGSDGFFYPTFAIYNAAPYATHFIVDVVGFFDDNTMSGGTRFQPLTSPARIVDTRLGQGATTLGATTTRTVLTPSVIAGWNTYALVANTTAVLPSAATFVSLFPHGTTRSPASNLNPATGQTAANMAIIGVGGHNDFDIYNNAGTTNVLVDVAGTMEYYPALPTGVFRESPAARAKALAPSAKVSPHGHAPPSNAVSPGYLAR